MINADELRDANPWQPMTVKIDLKHLGKLIEELNECATAAARCIIQGIDEKEPVTGKPNQEWLEDEIGDVLANIELVVIHFDLERTRIIARYNKKFRYLKQWHNQL